MKLAVQLYTLRESLAKDLDGTLKRTSDSGYEHVETAGTCGLSPKEFRKRLDSVGLRAVSCHVGLDDVEGGLSESEDMAKTLGAEWLVVPWISEAEYAGGWDRFGERLGSVAETVLSRGLKFAYHNHDFEFREQNGRPGFETLWESAPETVEAELDVYWAHRAGRDPAEVLRALSGRVPLVHFKDGRDGAFTPVGEGSLEWEPIVAAARTAGVEWAIVELDESPSDPVDCVAASYLYLTGLGVED
ncbi:MAG: sugar phosphate isomerase/epimerase [Armatimonadetes bacterium]|nr:sugar phosphate isomerase/epimerase [Armatimonadota bacterium]